MSKRNAIKYVQNEEPAFIRQFKEKIGYKEGPDVDTKRQKLEYEENEDRSDTEEEKPVVVVLKTGDLTAEEFEEVDMLKKKLEEQEAIRDGKIKFKKPTKKGEDEAPTEKSETEQLAKSVKGKEKNKDKKKKEKEKKKKPSLLSFDDEEDEEG